MESNAEEYTEVEFVTWLKGRYIAWTLGALDLDEEDILDQFSQDGGLPWRTYAQRKVGVNGAFIRALHDLLCTKMSVEEAQEFILRGFQVS